MTGSFVFPRVQAIPQIGRASLRLDGVERVGYEFGDNGSRPFLFPLLGPSGAQLTRMGHPNPIGHEHHKSVWFGHEKVAGTNFWAEPAGTDVRIYHRRVRLYQDGQGWGGLTAELDWWARGQSVMKQHLTLVLEPLPNGDYALDLQSRFEVARHGVPVELGQTNFGFLGVRVAKTLSEQFGGGRLTSAEGATGEKDIFGKPSRWVDYSGPSAPGTVEGICYMDHPSNPRFPTLWHVRRDGWMEAAFNFASAHGLAKDHPLDLRYRLLIHGGSAQPGALNQAWEEFARTPPYSIVPQQRQELAMLKRMTET